MIAYIEDTDKTYDACIKHHLRSHNARHSTITDHSACYFYKATKDSFSGGMAASYFWDWVSLRDIVYDSLETLKAMVDEALSFYRNKALGLKTFTTVDTLKEALLQSGFTLSKAARIGSDTYFYLVHDMTDATPVNPSVYQSDACEERYIERVQAFNEAHQLNVAGSAFDYVALDDRECIGGVQTTTYGDLLYVDRLAVDSTYRHRAIGSTLMDKVEAHARTSGIKTIALGTTSFQALDFYKKRGYHVVYEHQHCPKHETSYTMALDF